MAAGEDSRTRSTASQMSGIVTRKCGATVYQASPVSTVIPPITAWATTPRGMVAASSTSRPRRGRTLRAASRQAPVTMTSAMPRSRLPNSTHWCRTAISGWGTGTRLPGKHWGHVGQPRPDPVTRTTAPVTAMPA
jgi:hypothetical protein